MPTRLRTALVAVASCLAAASAAVAQQQQQQQAPRRFDAMHCFGGTTQTLGQGRGYNIASLDFRGAVRAAEEGGPLDRHVSRCLATGGTVGDGPNRLHGFCEFAASPEDRVLLQWTLEGARGTGRLVAGTGRYEGVSGEYAFRPVPFPAVEPGVLRGCTHLTGEFTTPAGR